MPFDFPILDFLQEHLRSGTMDFIMRWITVLGDGGIFWIALILITLIIPKTRTAGGYAALSLFIEFVFCNLILKNAVARVRPYDINTSVALLIKPPGDFSFPSGHAGASFATTAGLFFGGSKLWIPACILSAVISFSRIYLYVHYPTDVIAGILLGIFSGWAAMIIIKTISGRLGKKQ